MDRQEKKDSRERLSQIEHPNDPGASRNPMGIHGRDTMPSSAKFTATVQIPIDGVLHPKTSLCYK